MWHSILSLSPICKNILGMKIILIIFLFAFLKKSVNINFDMNKSHFFAFFVHKLISAKKTKDFQFQHLLFSP